MIFLDSNVPMYLVGAEHPIKTKARAALERLISGAERMGVTRILSFDRGFDQVPGLERIEG